MTGLIFVGLIVAVWVVTNRRKKRERENKKKKQQGPGRSPETAEIIYDLKTIEVFVRRQRCHCNGRVYARAEAPVPGYSNMRVAVCECIRCEEVHRFYFEINYLN